MKSILLSIAALLSLHVQAQTIITGQARDQKGRPVPGVSLTVKGSYDGGTSDSTGQFSFKTFEQGDQTLIASSIGYRPYEQQIALAGGTLKQHITLKEAPDELKAVVITAGTFEAADAKRTTVLNSIDIVTTASANADVTSAIRTLPGAQQVGESEGLFVRGGTAGETKIFIDGTLVNNFFFSGVPDIAQRGRFSPFLFKGTVFSSGGYSAQYGQALSSVLLLESIDLPEMSSSSIGVSTVGLSAGYQHLSKDKKSSWGGGYNYTNLLPYFKLVKQAPDYFQVPEYHNGEVNYRLRTSKTGMLKLYGYFNNNRLGLRRPDIDSADFKNAFGLRNVNFYGNLSWKESLNDDWKMIWGASFSTNTDRIENQLQNASNVKQQWPFFPFNRKNFSSIGRSDLAVIKAVFERKLQGLSAARFGGEVFYQADRNTFSNDSITGFVTSMEDRLAAGFAEVDLYITNDLAAKIGGRVEQSSLLDKANVAPRISLAYKLGEAGQASLAYGTFYQKPENSYFLRNYRFIAPAYTKATHYILNYQKVSRAYTLRVEAFYKDYDGLVKNVPVAGSADKVQNTGYGYAKGFELFWRDRKTFKNFDYWVSYSFLDTRRDFTIYPYAIEPNFAAKHTASLVLKKFVSPLKTQFNASYTFATGRPYYNIGLDQHTAAYRIFDQGRTKNYNNLSFSLNYLPNINRPGAGRFTVFVFSVTNVLGAQQEFGYNYSYNRQRKEPIGLPANRFVFFGCFLSFGVDRTEDVINSNL